MNNRNRFLSLLLSCGIALSFSATALGADKLSRISEGSYRLFEEGKSIDGVLWRGVDVSHWQGEIDWKTAAANDVHFVMLGTRYQGNVDPLFRQNAEDASAAGIALGAYIYSYATSVEMAEQEADFILELIRDYPISYPIAFDAENEASLGSLPKDEITEIVHAFCRRIRDAGYYPILYANDYWLTNKLDMEALAEYPVWVAAYERLPKCKNPVMWQGTESGSIEGITGGVDIDLQFQDFSAKIPANSWKKFNGLWYYYENYRMQKNALIYDGTNSYYLNADGTIFTGGWKSLSDKKYYFDPASGIMRLGWKKIDSSWYYFAPDGNLQTGWVQDAGGWYYMDPQGVMQTGVVNVNDVLYYLGQDGLMYHDTKVEHNGKTWAIDSSGAMSEYHEETAAESSAESAAEGSTEAEAAAARASQDGTSQGDASGESITHVETKPSSASQSSSSGTGTVMPAGQP